MSALAQALRSILLLPSPAPPVNPNPKSTPLRPPSFLHLHQASVPNSASYRLGPPSEDLAAAGSSTVVPGSPFLPHYASRLLGVPPERGMETDRSEDESNIPPPCVVVVGSGARLEVLRTDVPSMNVLFRVPSIPAFRSLVLPGVESDVFPDGGSKTKDVLLLSELDSIRRSGGGGNLPSQTGAGVAPPSPSGRVLRPHEVGILDIGSWTRCAGLVGHRREVTPLIRWPESWKGDVADQIVVSGSKDATVRIWTLKTMSEKQALMGHSGVVLGLSALEEERWIVSGSYDRTVVIWDVNTCAPIKTLEGRNQVRFVRCSGRNEGQENDGLVPSLGSVLFVSRDAGVVQVIDPKTFRVVGRMKHFVDSFPSVDSLLFHPARPWTIFTGSSEGEIVLWDSRLLSSPVMRCQLHGKGTIWQIIDAGMHHFASCGSDGSVRVWNDQMKLCGEYLGDKKIYSLSRLRELSGIGGLYPQMMQIVTEVFNDAITELGERQLPAVAPSIDSEVEDEGEESHEKHSASQNELVRSVVAEGLRVSLSLEQLEKRMSEKFAASAREIEAVKKRAIATSSEANAKAVAALGLQMAAVSGRVDAALDRLSSVDAVLKKVVDAVTDLISGREVPEESQ